MGHAQEQQLSPCPAADGLGLFGGGGEQLFSYSSNASGESVRAICFFVCFDDASPLNRHGYGLTKE